MTTTRPICLRRSIEIKYQSMFAAVGLRLAMRRRERVYQRADGRWRMADGGWRARLRRWRMADGRWRSAAAPMAAFADGGFANGLAHPRESCCLPDWAVGPSAICHPPSAIRHLPSAISHPPSAISEAAISELRWRRRAGIGKLRRFFCTRCHLRLRMTPNLERSFFNAQVDAGQFQSVEMDSHRHRGGVRVRFRVPRHGTRRCAAREARHLQLRRARERRDHFLSPLLPAA